jgi:hypothetical protein
MPLLLRAAPARRPRSTARRAGASLATGALALALAGCGGFFGRAPDDRITVDLPVSRSEAVRRTLASFRRQGYTVRETLTSASQPETEMFREEGPAGTAETVFRAEVTGSDRAARVVLTGSYRRIQLRGAVRLKAEPVRDTDDALEQVLWGRLRNLALVIRRPTP